MAEEVQKIVVPKETVSDDTYKVTSILFKNGDFVKKGTIIGSIETSKADIDIESPADGYVFYTCNVSDNISVGDVFALLAAHKNINPQQHIQPEIKHPDRSEKPSSPAVHSARISKQALELIKLHNIDIHVFEGKNLISRKDVEEYLTEQKKIRSQDSEAERAKAKISTHVIIIGGGKHTRALIDIIEQSKTYNIVGIVYTHQPPSPNFINYPVLGGTNDLEKIYEQICDSAVIGFGGIEKPGERIKVYEKLKKIGFRLPNIIHPKSTIEPTAQIGEGNQIFAGAIIGSYANIGNICIINSNAVVSHDCVLHDNVHVTPGAVLGGSVRVGKNTIVGMNASVYYGVEIGTNCILTNGANVFKNIQDNEIVK